jgi:hypothetical protein
MPLLAAALGVAARSCLLPSPHPRSARLGRPGRGAGNRRALRPESNANCLRALGRVRRGPFRQLYNSQQQQRQASAARGLPQALNFQAQQQGVRALAAPAAAAPRHSPALHVPLGSAPSAAARRIAPKNSDSRWGFTPRSPTPSRSWPIASISTRAPWPRSRSSAPPAAPSPSPAAAGAGHESRTQKSSGGAGRGARGGAEHVCGQGGQRRCGK